MSKASELIESMHPQKGVELQFDQPETHLASNLYWCYEGLENAFTEIIK